MTLIVFLTNLTGLKKMLNEKSMFRITENMLKDGGSFAKSLAKTYRLGDKKNQGILRVAFSSLFKKYDYE